MILNLQYLRGVAALMVVLFHVTDSAGRLGAHVDLPSFAIGFAGVDIFFVVSGFIIWTTTRGPGQRPLLFLTKRAVRIVPLYWLLTLILANVAVLMPNLLQTTVFRLDHLLASLAFVPFVHPNLGDYNPVLIVGWTLNYEMAFYALFALVLLLPQRAQFGASMGLAIGIVAFGAASGAPGVLGFYSKPIVLEFAAGIAIGAAYTRGWRIPPRLCVAMMSAGTSLFLVNAFTEGERLILAGVPAMLLVSGAVFFERETGPVRVPLLRVLGDASYSIYLTHIFTLPVVQILWVRLGLPNGGSADLAFIAASTLACIVGGWICYRALERPLMAALRPIADPRARRRVEARA